MDGEEFEAHLKDCSVLINLAGKSDGSDSQLHASNVSAQRQLASLIPREIDSVVHVSSVNVLFRDIDVYGQTKWLGEGCWQEIISPNRLKIVRASWVYGGHDDSKLLSLAHRLRRLPLVPLVALGQMRPIHVSDFCILLTLLAMSGLKTASPAVISGIQSVNYGELISLVASVTGNSVRTIRVPRSLISLSIGILRCLLLRRKANRLAALQIDKDWHLPWQDLCEYAESPVTLDEGIRSTLRVADA